MPPVFDGTRPTRWRNSPRRSASTSDLHEGTARFQRGAYRPGTFDHTALDDCRTEGLDPAKTHWALPIDTPPFTAYPLKPGITFTYLGLKTDETAAVRFDDTPSPNLFVAGEMMAGNSSARAIRPASA